MKGEYDCWVHMVWSEVCGWMHGCGWWFWLTETWQGKVQQNGRVKRLNAGMGKWWIKFGLWYIFKLRKKDDWCSINGIRVFVRVVAASLVATSGRLINSLLIYSISSIDGARIERQLVSISLLFAADSLDGHVANVLVEESSHASVEKIESKRHLPKWATTRSDRGEYNTQHGSCRRRCGTDCNKGARVVALAMFMFDLRKRNIRVDRAGMCGVNESWKLETERDTLTPPWIASHHIVH